MPGTTTPMPSQPSTSGWSASNRLMRSASRPINSFGSRTVGKLLAPVIGVPSRSASITNVSLARMSAATTARRRESM